jgi:mannose-6-phosphate isomerase-like protein (cupin superfamily)
MDNQALSGIIAISDYDGEGLKRVVESGEWFVGIKNYKPFNDVNNLVALERHMLTDEVFTLLEGTCILLVDRSANQSGTEIVSVPMEKGKVYCINKGVWHNTIVSQDVKIILVENRNTSMENSEMYDLTPEQIATLTKDLKAKYFK